MIQYSLVKGVLENRESTSSSSWASDGEEDRKKNETMKSGQNDDREEHAEVVNLEYLGSCECENDDTYKLGESDAL